MFKTELHCHTRDASGCSNMSAEATVERYLEYGYTTLVITNHFTAFSGMDDPELWLKQVDSTYVAYDNLVKASKGRLNILLGMEARLTCNGNDYLTFGGFDREFLEKTGSAFLKRNIFEYCDMIHERGGFVSQAHPFRYNQVMTQPGPLDGIEVFNGHFKHDSHNDFAYMWAEKYHKIKTSGTDHHDDDHYPDGGIETDIPVTSIDQLISILRCGNYSLIMDYPKGRPHYDDRGTFLGLFN